LGKSNGLYEMPGEPRHRKGVTAERIRGSVKELFKREKVCYPVIEDSVQPPESSRGTIPVWPNWQNA